MAKKDTGKIEFPEPAVFVVDDDDAVRDALSMLIESMGNKVKSYSNVQAFLDEYKSEMTGCLVLDVRLPRISGLELQEYMKRQKINLPVIFISGHGTVAMAVRTLKAGAVDFLEKPFDDQMLLDSIQKAIELDRQNRSAEECQAKIRDLLQTLSKREIEVLRMLIQGKANKAIAHDMQLSTKTVETHRAHIMRKLGVNSMAGLMWMALSSGEFNEIPDHLPFPAPHFRPEPFALR